MRLYHGIFVCNRDTELAASHIDDTNRVCRQTGGPEPEWVSCFYGRQCNAPLDLPHVALGFDDYYENLPMKTYAMLRHALKVEGWDRFLKTDANSRLTYVNWGAVSERDLVGFTGRARLASGESIPRSSGRLLPPDKVTQPACREEYRGPLCEIWCGGPAYILSRRLAEIIVSYGIWHARSFAAEDGMVSTIAYQHGMGAFPGIGYFSDGRNQKND